MRAIESFWRWVRILIVLACAATISACLPSIEQAGPSIVLAPVTGGPGAMVTVIGREFPPEMPVSVRLGPPSVGTTPHSYADAVSGTEGTLALSFTMPSHWPDGTPITQANLVVIVLNQDASTKALASFAYVPASGVGNLPGEPHVDVAPRVVFAWHRERGEGLCHDVTGYWSGHVEVVSCAGAQQVAHKQLSDQSTDWIRAWTQTYRGFEAEKSSGTGDDRVISRIVFVGNGSREASESQVRMVQTILETLVFQQ
jgi:hypothetical protein